MKKKQIAAGKPIRAGRTRTRVPDRVVLEEEMEIRGGQVEMELEWSWKTDGHG